MDHPVVGKLPNIHSAIIAGGKQKVAVGGKAQGVDRLVMRV
jgi:hypothetical protein